MESKAPHVNQKLQLQFNEFKETLEQLSQKIGQLKTDLDEHDVVLNTLKTVPEDRKCFRMIGGALVEKTAGSVVPVLDSKIISMKEAVVSLEKERQRTLKEFEDWQKKTNVKIVKQ
ncbi:hypothetical protein PACTADRAFT_51977 [Pachysolen tannophilus NRRL Y-2460]|uniref:Prefoldin subunit 2 n=1 Tax=Pachysolen tannophilus NRRL Y-2460 TaxID=669874 RepID=A0A1E4TNX4_PACTA|nr:hypothetical protein PACTADRAFT_51977 [Pachysolen tannophilus NRRL Y-2460]